MFNVIFAIHIMSVNGYIFGFLKILYFLLDMDKPVVILEST